MSALVQFVPDALRSSDRPPAPVLSTDAAASHSDQLAWRRRRYGLITGMRVPLVLLAFAFHQVWWMAAALLLASVPLPWIAVLIANDLPPRRRDDPHRLPPAMPRSLEASPHEVIDVTGPPADPSIR